ncbi:hypothetical protein C9J85_03200 [Haloferax sp. wsp5]|nr:hypothetical protein C9J85_03200 [Haloferax sp. wsp5]
MCFRTDGIDLSGADLSLAGRRTNTATSKTPRTDCALGPDDPSFRPLAAPGGRADAPALRNDSRPRLSASGSMPSVSNGELHIGASRNSRRKSTL